MHRTHLLDALEQYQTRYPEEAAMIDRFTGFVQAHPDCFERTLTIGHVTGSAWVVNAPGTHVLLTHHRKLDKWLQLGGHADGDADVCGVALREAREESGLAHLQVIMDPIFDIDIHPIPARGTEPAHDHYDVRFAIRVVGSDLFTVSDESHALSWVAIETVRDDFEEESMRRMARKWCQHHLAGNLRH